MKDPNAALSLANLVLKDYRDTAARNLELIWGNWLLRTFGGGRFKPIDSRPLKEALTLEKPADGGSINRVHLIVVQNRPGPAFSAIGLRLMLRLHGAIYSANANLLLQKDRPPSKQEMDGMKHLWAGIFADSSFLSEASRHGYALVGSASAKKAMHWQIKVPGAPEPDEADMRALDALNEAHRTRLQTMAKNISRKWLWGKAAAEHLSRESPIEYPDIREFQETEGAFVLNDVWIPAGYADGIRKDLALMQAKAMVDRPAGQAKRAG